MNGAENQTTPPASQDPEAIRLHTLLEPVVAAQNLFLEEILLSGRGAGRIVEILLDLPEDQDGGVSLDAIAEATHAISDALDADPGMGREPYELLVSSPGVSRPLTKVRHWKRNLGRLVKINVIGEDNVLGRILEVSDDSVTILPRIEGRKGTRPKDGPETTLAFSSIRHGKVEIEFSHEDPAEEETVAETEEA